jgi:zinc/manganese transport system permease protein
VAAGIGVAATWIGIVLAYDSYYWPPAHRGWPVSFFVVTLIVVGYLVSYLRPHRAPHQDLQHAHDTQDPDLVYGGPACSRP